MALHEVLLDRLCATFDPPVNLELLRELGRSFFLWLQPNLAARLGQFLMNFLMTFGP